MQRRTHIEGWEGEQNTCGMYKTGAAARKYFMDSTEAETCRGMG